MMPNRKETYLANERMSLLYEAANNLTDLLSIQIPSEMIQLYTKTLFFSIYIMEYNAPSILFSVLMCNHCHSLRVKVIVVLTILFSGVLQ